MKNWKKIYKINNYKNIEDFLISNLLLVSKHITYNVEIWGN